MALPSTTRPKEIEELEDDATRPKKAKQLEDDFGDLCVSGKDKKKMGQTKSQAFQSQLKSWYKRRRQDLITRVDLKRAAVRICDINRMQYEQLPNDWVETFKNEHKIRFLKHRMKRRRSQSKTIPRKRPRLVGVVAEVERSSSSASSTSSDESEESAELEVVQQPGCSSGAPSKSKVGSQPQSNEPSSSVGSSQSKVPQGKTKKIVDLTKDRAPETWLSAFAKGIVLPRVLSFHSTDDATIMYYDYSPKLKDQFGREIKLAAQPRHNRNVDALYPEHG